MSVFRVLNKTTYCMRRKIRSQDRFMKWKIRTPGPLSASPICQITLPSLGAVLTVSVRKSTFSPYLLISLSLRLRVYSALLDKNYMVNFSNYHLKQGNPSIVDISVNTY